MTESREQKPQITQTADPTRNKLATGLATAAVVGVGAALIEIEWVPGLLLGVAAMVAPELVPKLGRGIRPLVHSAIKNGYAATRKTRGWMAEAGEQVSDMIAEVRSASIENESTDFSAVQHAPDAQSVDAASPLEVGHAEPQGESLKKAGSPVAV